MSPLLLPSPSLGPHASSAQQSCLMTRPVHPVRSGPLPRAQAHVDCPLASERHGRWRVPLAGHCNGRRASVGPSKARARRATLSRLCALGGGESSALEPRRQAGCLSRQGLCHLRLEFLRLLVNSRLVVEVCSGGMDGAVASQLSSQCGVAWRRDLMGVGSYDCFLRINLRVSPLQCIACRMVGMDPHVILILKLYTVMTRNPQAISHS